MKRTLLFMVLVCALCSGLKAQTEQGLRLVGGTMGFSVANDENTTLKSRTNSFNISPYFGFFINNDLAIALSVGYSNSDVNFLNNSISLNKDYKTRQDMFTITPFIRYYAAVSKKFKVFGQFNIYSGFGTATIKYQDPSAGPNGNMMIKQHGAALIPGISFFPTSHLGIECSFSGISYSSWAFADSSNKTLIENRTFSFGINSFNPNIGVNYYF